MQDLNTLKVNLGIDNDTEILNLLNEPINIIEDYPDISNELILNIDKIHSSISEMKVYMKENKI